MGTKRLGTQMPWLCFDSLDHRMYIVSLLPRARGLKKQFKTGNDVSQIPLTAGYRDLMHLDTTEAAACN